MRYLFKIIGVIVRRSLGNGGLLFLSACGPTSVFGFHVPSVFERPVQQDQLGLTLQGRHDMVMLDLSSAPVTIRITMTSLEQSVIDKVAERLNADGLSSLVVESLSDAFGRERLPSADEILDVLSAETGEPTA